MNFSAVSPETTDDLLNVISKVKNSNFRFGAGYTDLILELNKQPQKDLTVINLAKLNDREFTSIQTLPEGFRIGALVSVTDLISDQGLQRQFPLLIDAANSLASPQIRSVATVGGNLCTASPAGDISCALIAMKATCEILSVDGAIKNVPLSKFFTGVKSTLLKKDEILRSVFVPKNKSGEIVFSGFIKIGTRNSMEIAIVSLAYHILVDEKKTVISSSLAIGSVAPVIRYVDSASEFLLGKNITQLTGKEKANFADLVLEYASPISDLRASAWYRREVLRNISGSIFD